MSKKFFERAIEEPAKVLEETVDLAQKAYDHTLQKPLAKAKSYWDKLGPGLTTGAADDDPSGIATYSQAGAKYGFQLLWLAGFTFPMMAIIQEMCARIGIVTGRGLAANIRHHFPRWVLYTCTILLFMANTFNLGADLGAMAQATQLLFPKIGFAVLVIVFTILCLSLQIFNAYATYAKYLKWLALVLFSYVLSTLMIKGLDWPSILHHAVTPSLDIFSRDQVALVVGILGTTISPYLFFWQTSQEVEEKIQAGQTTVKLRQESPSDGEINNMRVDIWSGMLLSNLAMFFIIAASAATLNLHGITNIGTAAQAAEALRPLAGDASYLLFTIGIIGVGLLGVPVLAGSASYAISESFGWKEGLYHKLKEAYAFYGVLIISMLVGFSLNFVGLDPIKALVLAAILNGLVAPVVLVLIVILGSNHQVMGRYKNRTLTTVFGWLVVLFMAAAGIATIVYSLTS